MKTSEKDIVGGIQLTRREYEMANKLTDQGYNYWIYYYSGWGTDGLVSQKVLFRELRNENRIEPVRYKCDFRERRDKENGILHYRKQKGFSQIEAANLLEVPASCLSKYETGESRCPVTVYQKLSRLYGVQIDELLKEYTVQYSD